MNGSSTGAAAPVTGAFLLVALLASAGCHVSSSVSDGAPPSQPPDPRETERPPEPLCEDGPCVRVGDDDGVSCASTDKRYYAGITGWSDFVERQMLRPSSEADGASPELFEATWRAEWMHAMPWPGAVVQLAPCARFDGGPQVPASCVRLNPPYFAGLALAPENVFIPVEGKAMLGGYLAATVQIAWPPPQPATVAIAIQSLRTKDVDRYDALAVGASFAWGPWRATVVRIVPPTKWIQGWVEIKLA